jgi:ATP-dependent Clp protease adaptor protein ClpS
MPSHRADPKEGVMLRDKPRTRRPPMYRVLLHNDDYTPMEFVVMVLRMVFAKTDQAATKIMLDVHRKGIGVAGVYCFEVAETKVAKVSEMAKADQFPLKCSMEPESDGEEG